MNKHLIKNFDSLATTDLRTKALEIAEAGLWAINTHNVITTNIKLEGNILTIQNLTFDLKTFNNIYLIAFGKAAFDAAASIAQILGDKITSGVAIDIKDTVSKYPNIQFITGTHPTPSPQNVLASQEIIKLSSNITDKDLVLCVVSGGGSALLVGSEEEVKIGKQIYDAFLPTGGDIVEMNTLRKHASVLKAGNLAKIFFPARMVGLIFSDIPGSKIEDVASGPTFKDTSTLEDVNTLIEKYKLEGVKDIKFTETPKEDKYFENVSNLLLVSNKNAVQAMQQKASELGFQTEIYSQNTYEDVSTLAKNMNLRMQQNHARIAGGEPKLIVAKAHGQGGRNQQLALEAIQYLDDHAVFISIASDGVDNSTAAGGIVDKSSLQKIPDYKAAVESLDAFNILKASGDQIITDPTGSNVADLMISLKI